MALFRGHRFVVLPYSYPIFSFLHCCYRSGFIRSFCLQEDRLFVHLKFYRGESVIKGINFISKPCKPVSFRYKEFFNSLCSRSFLIVETPQGFYNSFECRKKRIGGKVLCVIK